MRVGASIRVLGLALALAAPSEHVAAADTVVGTGATSRVHFTVGRAICRQLERASPGTTCEVLPIVGRDAAEPLAVLAAVRNGAIEVGIVGSDWQHHAYQGTGPVAFMDVKFDTIRSLFSLHGEPFTLIARRDARIDSLEDLRGKRVNIGSPGSGQRAMMEMVMAAKGWTRKSFQLADELPAAGQFLALCHGTVQAIVITTAHPSDEVAKAIDLCRAKVVEVADTEIEKLVRDNPYLAATQVAGGLYEGMAKPAVSSDTVDEDTAYRVVKSVFDNLDRFKRLHTALGGLTPEQMMRDGQSAPAHPGALRYFREKDMQ
jgi:TRAP transporter TAXI family solute receptor